MKEYNFKAEKAFSSDFILRKKAKNEEGPIVKSIKIPSKMNSGVSVQGGVAANGNMVRVDVFEKDGKFYLVPIYVADIVSGEIPNKAIKASTTKENWPVMDESYNFKFSLYKNDLICLKKKKEKEMFIYYRGTDSSTGSISYIHHYGGKEDRIGVQKMELFEKYQVDLLGNYYKVKNEKRKGGKN